MSIGHWKPVLKNRGRNRTVRGKTFKTKEEAEKYIADNKLNAQVILASYPDAATKKYRILTE